MAFRTFIRKHRERLRRLTLILGSVVLVIHAYGLVLTFMPVPTTILMSQRASAGETIRKEWTSLDQISPYLVYAVIGAEDSRFCSHHGIDLKALEKVLEERGAGKSRRGGSTITQQTAKNVYLWNGGGWIRKVPETYLALYLDTIWSKRRIMEVYLNIAEWGDGIFGAEAAAQQRFGKSALDLTAREAALLAAVLPSPNKWRVDPPGDYVSRRARNLMTRTADVKWGGYGQCVKIDESQLRFPVPNKPEAPQDPTEQSEPSQQTGEEEKEQSFETLLDELEQSVDETRKPSQDNETEEIIDDQVQDRL